MMESCCYIERVATHDALTGDPKRLIADPMVRRRMSRVVKMGVLTALEALRGEVPDAIVTATGFGCLADSERFLRNVLERAEELVPPTPFIQSTFNTIGAQVALLTGCHGPNTTFAHRGHSFESALIEAWMMLAEGSARRILVGAADERTEAQHRIMERMGLWRNVRCGEGAAFMVVAAQPTAETRGCIRAIDFPDPSLDAGQIARRYDADRVVDGSLDPEGCHPTLAARTVVRGLAELETGARRVALYHRYLGGPPAVILLTPCR